MNGWDKLLGSLARPAAVALTVFGWFAAVWHVPAFIRLAALNVGATPDGANVAGQIAILGSLGGFTVLACLIVFIVFEDRA